HVAGNLEINGDFRPGGNSGTAGQILVSQGANSPPQWQTPVTQWYLWAVDFFADATNFQGWSVTGGTNAIYTCGNVFLLGGYGNCGSGCSMSKTFSNLPPHSQVMVEIFWWSLDSWDQSGSSTDYVELWIDGNYVTTALPPLPYGILASTTNANNNRKTDQSYCGGAAEIDQGPLSFMTVTNHTASTLTVQVKCMVDQPATDESCGLQAVRVYIK
ncbi:MAG: hypothetical protein GXO48_04455, partial [Chlorobi bacterium]|nr:hypothetical protein [Chlorobiota bacterium]